MSSAHDYGKERGPQGDHGQTGTAGPAGVAGERGPRGVPGVGLTRQAAVFGFVFFIILLALVALRTEINDRSIRQANLASQSRQDQVRLESCIGGRAILDRFNDQQEQLAQIDRGLLDEQISRGNPDPVLTETLSQRIRVYTSGVQPLPSCEDLIPEGAP